MQTMGRGRGRGREKNNKAISETNLANIPEEIVLDILSRLPLKNLVRFTCVSKQWRSLIQDYMRSVRRQKVLVCKNHSLHSVDEEGYVESIREPWKKVLRYHVYLEILGSCNGLLLVRMDDDLFLWNPLTRCSKKVLGYEDLKDDDHGIVSGLCFDSSSNEYKVVMAFTHQSPDYGVEFVVVGSFRRKLWTQVRFPYKVSSLKSGPLVNEHLHWFASKKISGHEFLSPCQIFSFCPQTNKFKKVPMPQPSHGDGDGDIILGLGALYGCLCMTRFDGPTPSYGNVEVLAMKEYGMESSWTVMFTVSNLFGLFPSYDELVPLCLTKNDDEVIMKFCIGTNKGYIRAYNPKDNSHRDILVGANHSVMYEESLVAPPDYNWEEEELRGEAKYVEKFLSCSPQKLKRGRDGFWESVDLEEEEYEEYDSESEFESESVSEELVSDSEADEEYGSELESISEELVEEE